MRTHQQPTTQDTPQSIEDKPLRVGSSSVSWALLIAGTIALGGCSNVAPPPSPASESTATPVPPDAAALATLSSAAAVDSRAIMCGEENLAALRVVWERYPTDAIVREQLRGQLETCMQWDGLAEVLEAKPETERTDADRLELAGLYLRHLGRFADAEAVAVPLAEGRPDNMDIVSLAAASLYYQDRVEEAVPMIDRLWDQMVAAQNSDIMTMRAVAFLDAGNPGRAVKILDQVIELYPRHTFALTTLARARQDMGDEAGAQEAREINEVMRTEASLKARQGQRMADLTRTIQAAWDAGEFEEVERNALRMLDIAPEETAPEIYRVLGDTYNELGRPEDARAAFEQAAELERTLKAESEG